MEGGSELQLHGDTYWRCSYVWRLGRKDVITHVERGRGRSASLDCHPCVASQHRDFNRVKQIYHCLVLKGLAHKTKQDIGRERSVREEGTVVEACRGLSQLRYRHMAMSFPVYYLQVPYGYTYTTVHCTPHQDQDAVLLLYRDNIQRTVR